MPEPQRHETLSFEKGLNEQYEATTLDKGACTQLENWIPEPYGGFRARRGWSNASTTGAPATRKARSIGYLPLTSELPTQVQKAENDNSQSINDLTRAEVSATWPAATTAGNLLICVISAWMPSATAGPGSNVVNAQMSSSGWTVAAASASANPATNGTGYLGIYYKQNAASESGAVTMNYGQTSALFSGTFYGQIQLFEYSGMAVSSVLDKTATAALGAPAGSLAVGPTAATTQAQELVFAAGAGDNAAPSSFSSQALTLLETTGGRLASGATNVQATGTQATQANFSGSNDASVVHIVTFKAKLTTGTGYHLVQHAGTTTADIYRILSSALSSGTWSLVESVTTDGSQPIAFAAGLGKVLYTQKGFSTIRSYDGATAASIASSPPGQALVFHRNRFFTGGTVANPSRLWYSDLASTTSWLSTSYIDVSADDGDEIMDLAVFEDGVLVVKRESLHYLSGTGPDNFAVNRLNAGGGFPGRCAVVTPYGVLLAAQRGVYLWAGGGVDRISGPVESSYQIAGSYVSTAYANGVAYICDSGTGTIYALDMLKGVWWLEKVANPTTDGPNVIGNRVDLLLYGPNSSTTTSLLAYRQMPTATRARDFTLGESFVAYTAVLPLEPTHAAVTPRHLSLRVRQRGGGASDPGIVITPNYDGVDQATITVSPKAGGAQVFEVRKDVGSRRGARQVRFKFTQTLTSAQDSLMEIEEAVLGYDVEPIR